MKQLQRANVLTHKLSRGFTAVEIVVALGILVLIFGIGTQVFVTSRNAKQLETYTDGVSSKLEEAKTNALAGKNGTNFGVKFSTTSYTYFNGSSYSSSATSNVPYNLLGKYNISNNIPGTDDAILFTRLTGIPSATGTIVISDGGSPAKTATVTVGVMGDVSVTK